MTPGAALGGELPDWTPKAVVFDCDGLLMDTEPCWTVAETELFRRRGMPFGDEQKALLIGRSLEEAAVTLAEVFDEPGQDAAIIDELMVLVRESVTSSAEIMPGAAEIVALAEQRVPVAVASNSPRALLDTALKRGGLQDRFEISIAADEVARPKPAPDMYLEACARLGVDPGDALAFEDSGTGLKSAVAAGLRTVGIPTLVGKPLDADWTFGALTDSDLVGWVDSWGRA